MKYDCQTVSLTRLILTPQGRVMPLCKSCKTADCSHQIETRTISVFGVNEKMKCIINGGEPAIVVDCKGYTK